MSTHEICFSAKIMKKKKNLLISLFSGDINN